MTPATAAMYGKLLREFGRRLALFSAPCPPTRAAWSADVPKIIGCRSDDGIRGFTFFSPPFSPTFSLFFLIHVGRTRSSTCSTRRWRTNSPSTPASTLIRPAIFPRARPPTPAIRWRIAWSAARLIFFFFHDAFGLIGVLSAAVTKMGLQVRRLRRVCQPVPLQADVRALAGPLPRPHRWLRPL